MHDVVVIGGGPCGLAAAAYAREAGLDCLVVEKGGLVNTISRFPSAMRLYSTSDRLEIGNIPFLSEEERPTRQEALRYYRSAAMRMNLNVQTFHTVQRVERREDGFAIHAVNHNGRPRLFSGKSVILATGTYDQPRRLHIPGEELPKVSHYYSEGHSYAGRRVLVVGGKNSAVEAAIDLYRCGAEVTLVHRGDTVLKGIKPTLLLDIRNMIEKQRIRFYGGASVVTIEEEEVQVETPEGTVRLGNDFVFSLIGYRPDAAFLAGIGVDLDPETQVPVFDPVTYETNVPNVFVAGVLAGGITNKVFIDDGRLHGEAIAQELRGRLL